VNKIWQQLQPYWAISFQCSRSYKIVFISMYALFFLSYALMTASMFKSANASHAMEILLRSLIDTTIFFAASHFLIRPYLKLNLLRFGNYGSPLLKFVGATFILGMISVVLSLEIAKIEAFGSLNFNQIEVETQNSSGKNITVNMSRTQMILIGGFNQSVMYWIFALCYSFWHTLISKRQVQKQMHEAQLQQLTNQLNPHFLFNALNSIRALIYEDKDKAAHAVTQLSELFRIHLQAHLKPSSSLADEWLIAKHYLDIEQIRLEQRLQLDLQFDDSLWQQQLPTLSLLMLVENAIKHGISPNPQGGTLQIISCRPRQSRWQLQVNNSVGSSQAIHSTKTGLANLRQRLALSSPNHQLTWRKTDERFELCMELDDDQNPTR
jgi:hypothetical protein